MRSKQQQERIDKAVDELEVVLRKAQARANDPSKSDDREGAFGQHRDRADPDRLNESVEELLRLIQEGSNSESAGSSASTSSKPGDDKQRDPKLPWYRCQRTKRIDPLRDRNIDPPPWHSRGRSAGE